MTPVIEQALRARRDGGGKCFVPYVTGGFPAVDAGFLRALADAGADAIEVGIPFSDPVMDGGVIQEASRISLEAGTTPSQVLSTVAEADLTVPVAVMTYVNPVFRIGFENFLDRAAASRISGCILPDVPFDEADEWIGMCRERDVASIFLAAPDTVAERLEAIAAASTGFVYCVAAYGVTGARSKLSETAREVVGRLRPLTDLPLLVGVGIATPSQAVQACAFADGVIVGSALMAPLVDADAGAALAAAEAFANAIHG